MKFDTLTKDGITNPFDIQSSKSKRKRCKPYRLKITNTISPVLCDKIREFTESEHNWLSKSLEALYAKNVSLNDAIYEKWRNEKNWGGFTGYEEYSKQSNSSAVNESEDPDALNTSSTSSTSKENNFNPTNDADVVPTTADSTESANAAAPAKKSKNKRKRRAEQATAAAVEAEKESQKTVEFSPSFLPHQPIAGKTYPTIRFFSVELYYKDDSSFTKDSKDSDSKDLLIAGELGYTTGSSIYTSLTGFYDKTEDNSDSDINPNSTNTITKSKNLKYSGAGTAQLLLLGEHLIKRGIKYWDLGMSLPYKTKDLGAKDVPRKEWLKIVESSRDEIGRWIETTGEIDSDLTRRSGPTSSSNTDHHSTSSLIPTEKNLRNEQDSSTVPTVTKESTPESVESDLKKRKESSSGDIEKSDSGTK